MYAAQLSAYLASFNKVTGQKLSVMPSTMKSDVYNKWKFDMSYEDGGFQLDVVKVVNFVMKLLPHFMRNPCKYGLFFFKIVSTVLFSSNCFLDNRKTDIIGIITKIKN